MQKIPRKKVLAVASGGGHWIQLLRLRPAFDRHNVVYMTTDFGYISDLKSPPVIVRDANFDEKLNLGVMFFQVFLQVIMIRPDVVISTGAAPGFAAIFFGRVIGARTIWIDSIANSDKLSMSGRFAKWFAHLWLTQWPHLACDEGPDYWGSVI